MNKTAGIIEKITQGKMPTDKELLYLIGGKADSALLYECADHKKREVYGDGIYIRGLIEISNYCKNDCLYCGIRASNKNALRYRLTKEEILSCCKTGYENGFRTFVLQGGEDVYFDDDVLCDIVSSIKNAHPDCAITLSMGERPRESYLKLFASGATRYLLRHETANRTHYQSLHPEKMSPDKRKKCLFDLKDIGYQVGSGFMVGSPYQTDENLIEDLKFLKELDPDMIGIGPYISHRDTPFSGFENGDGQKCVRLIAILRLMFPHALIPATTALATLGSDMRKAALMAGANVVMPNLSPQSARENYTLYDNKAHSGAEAIEGLDRLKAMAKEINSVILTDKGDVKR